MRGFGNRVLKRTDIRVRGEWCQLYEEEIYNLYCLPNVMTINSRTQTGLVSRTGETAGHSD
jgi:hypothetical protein